MVGILDRLLEKWIAISKDMIIYAFIQSLVSNRYDKLTHTAFTYLFN